MKKYDLAEMQYLKAHYMTPSRIYPLYRLMRLKLRENDDNSAIDIAKQIKQIPINERHTGMKQLYSDCCRTLDSLIILRDSEICGNVIIP